MNSEGTLVLMVTAQGVRLLQESFHALGLGKEFCYCHQKQILSPGWNQRPWAGHGWSVSPTSLCVGFSLHSAGVRPALAKHSFLCFGPDSG